MQALQDLWVGAHRADQAGRELGKTLDELSAGGRAPSAEEKKALDDAMAGLRRQIDEVDDDLALLLARRFALTATVQGYKHRPGQEGRDAGREREIALRMAAHAPGLGADAIGRIMDVVIGESLDAYESDRHP